LKRHILSALALAALSAGAAAQAPRPDSPVFKEQKPATCAECGVVRSVKREETPQRITAEERKSTAGFVAQVPIGGDKPVVGSSTETRSELKPPVVTYEVTVRLDDGRYQIVRQDDAANLREGDKVRIERGKVVLQK
jgi:hypothetical protein